MRTTLLAVISAVCLSACKKDSDSDGALIASTPVGYPDLIGMTEFSLGSNVSIEKSCYSHEWSRLLRPKNLDFDDLTKGQLYVEIKSHMGCMGLIPLQFADNSNGVKFQFEKIILREKCAEYDAAEEKAVDFRYVQGMEDDKRQFYFQLDNSEQYCGKDLEDSFYFTER